MKHDCQKLEEDSKESLKRNNPKKKAFFTDKMPMDLSHSKKKGAECFLIFIDDKSRFVGIYVLKDKWRSVQEVYRVENSSGQKIKTLHTDNGGEYTSSEFEDYLRKKGIHHECTFSKTPEQNGVDERMNQMLMETVMLSDSKMPKKFWVEALSTASYVWNQSLVTAVTSDDTI